MPCLLPESSEPARTRRFGRTVVSAIVALTMIALLGFWLLLDHPELPNDLDRQDAPAIVKRDRPESRRSDYAGSRACVECHEDYFETFLQHPMGRSVAAASDITVAGMDEKGVTISPPGPRSYSVRASNDVVEHAEFWISGDSAGSELYRETVPVHFAIGSGQRGHSFVSNRGGILFMSSLTWYSQGQRWDLSPGYRREDHPRFERQILDGCVTCHVGRVNAVENEPHRFRPEAPFAEVAIGCERCHGPAQAHVDRHRNAELHRPDPIINPANLDPIRRESVCYQCHLHGLRRIPRYGRTEYDFRPGDELADIWVVFVQDSEVRKNESATAVSQVEQVTESRCFQESNGRLGCISCHDPHRVPKVEERDSFYKARCLNCHSNPETTCSQPEELRSRTAPGGSCIACHMPSFEASDVPHTSQTDHRILRRIPARQEHAARTLPHRKHRLFRAGGIPPSWEIERAEGLMQAQFAEQSASPPLAAAVLPKLVAAIRRAPDDVDVLDATIYLTALLGDSQEAMRIGESALKLAPNRESVIESLVLICEATGRAEAGLDYVERQLRLNPWRSESYQRKALFLARLGRTDEAIEAASEALKKNPLLKPARELLISLLRHSARNDEADSQQELLRKLSQ